MTVVFHIDGFLFLRLDLPLVKALTPSPPSPPLPPESKGLVNKRSLWRPVKLILHTLLEESRLQVL